MLAPFTTPKPPLPLSDLKTTSYPPEMYKHALVDDVLPFWLRHGMDHEHGGIITSLDRDGSIVDTDKSIWFQGRAAWTYATAYLTVERRAEWLAAAESCITFLRRFGADASGKLYFQVTRDGRPVRMRRYVYSESFAAIALAAYAAATGEARAADESLTAFDRYIDYSFTPGRMASKTDPNTRPMIGVGPRMIGIATAQEMMVHLGDVNVRGCSLSEWITTWISDIERLFFKSDLGVLLETVAPDGSIIDHADGRTLNPGHAIEASWFILHEGNLRGDRAMITLGLAILDGMWARGWDTEYGGLYYFRDLKGLPVQEYWHDMKFWWPHNEAVIATLLAWKMTADKKYLHMHEQVHGWSFKHFADPEFGEWYGYLHRDGSPSSRAKGTLWKGPFHLPRMLLYCHRLISPAGDTP